MVQIYTNHLYHHHEDQAPGAWYKFFGIRGIGINRLGHKLYTWPIAPIFNVACRLITCGD